MPSIKSKPVHVPLSNIKNADDGLKAKYDAKTQTLTISGKAASRIPASSAEPSIRSARRPWGGQRS
jgi:hypothetical protein